MNTPRAYSMVPIAPSQTSTRRPSNSRKSCIVLGVEPLAAERFRVDEQVRFGHHVETDGTHALPNRVGELMVVAEQVKSGPHGGEHLVDGRLARVDAAAFRMKRAWGLVGEEHIDAREPFALEHLVAHEMPSLVVAALPELERDRRDASTPRRRQCGRPRVIPARCERAAERRDPPRSHVVRPAVWQIEQRLGHGRSGHRRGNDVEIFVVAFDPVDRSNRREVLPIVVRDVANLNPERHAFVSRHDVLNAVERPVNVAERAYLHLSLAASGPHLVGPTQSAAPPVPLAWTCPTGPICPYRPCEGVAAAGTSRSALSHTKSSLLYTASS